MFGGMYDDYRLFSLNYIECHGVIISNECAVRDGLNDLCCIQCFDEHHSTVDLVSK